MKNTYEINEEHTRRMDSATNAAPGTVPNPGGANISVTREVTRLTRMQTCSIVIRLQPYGALGDRLLNMGDDSSRCNGGGLVLGVRPHNLRKCT